MGTKTISLELDAYEALRRAKRSERESFSSVVRRARWADAPPSAGQVLEGLEAAVEADRGFLLSDEDLNRIGRRRRSSRPRTRWQGR